MNNLKLANRPASSSRIRTRLDRDGRAGRPPSDRAQQRLGRGGGHATNKGQRPKSTGNMAANANAVDEPHTRTWWPRRTQAHKLLATADHDYQAGTGRRRRRTSVTRFVS